MDNPRLLSARHAANRPGRALTEICLSFPFRLLSSSAKMSRGGRSSARLQLDIALAGRLRGPNRDGAATYGTDAADNPASEAPVVWPKWDVTTV